MIDYAEVLRDLHRRRAEIDAAIQEIGRSIGPSVEAAPAMHLMPMLTRPVLSPQFGDQRAASL